MNESPDPLSALRDARRPMVTALERTDADLRRVLARKQFYESRLRDLDEMIETFSSIDVAGDSGVDAVLVGPDGGREAVIQVKRHAGSFDAAGRNTRDAILWVVDMEDRPYEASEIVDAVRELGVDSRPASVRSLLSKMAESGQIDRPSRGLYQRIKPGSEPAPAGMAARLRRVPVSQQRLPRPEEFMPMPPEPEDEPELDFHPDPDREEEQDTRDYSSELADYEAAARDAQADREETKS